MKIAHSAEVTKTAVDMEGAKHADIRILISAADGAKNFTMRMFELAPGGCTPLHRHPHEHEAFILDGNGVLVFEGAEHPLVKDDAVFVPGNTEHRFRNDGDTLLRMLCLIPNSAT